MGLLTDRRKYYKNLPYDAEIEYLENSEEGGGEAYIDTEIIIPQDDNDFYITFEVFGIGRIFSNYKDDNTTQFGIRFNTIKSNYIETRIYCGSFTKGAYKVINLNENIKYNGVLLRDGFYSFNSLTGMCDTTKQGTSNSHLYLFGFFDVTKNQLFNACQCRIYSFKYIHGDTPILDLIPVRKGDIGYMYDKVNGKLYGNSGSGKFILGPDKPKKPYDKEVEYLENDKEDETCVINTKYIPTGNDNEFQVEFMKTKNGITSSPYFANYTYPSNIDLNRDNLYRFFYGSSYYIANGYVENNFTYIPTVNNGVKYKISVDENNNVCVGEILYTPSKNLVKGIDSNNPLYMFATRPFVNTSGACRIYSFKWIKNGETTLDLIPVRKDGIGYFYNKVNGELLSAAVPEAIKFGPDIN